jgi:phage terminase large subunit
MIDKVEIEDEIAVPYGWSPRDYQLEAWQYLENGGLRADLCCHRRWGKDLFSLSRTVAAASQVPGIYWHILPKYSQARKTVWDGRTNDGQPYLDVFGPTEGGIIAKKRENEMLIELVNGSIWQIQGADDYDRLRGPNPRGVVFSEWGDMEPTIYHQIIEPILEANGGWAIFIYTPKGKNHAWEQRERMKKDPAWFVQTQTIEDTRDEKGNPIVSRERIEKMREGGTPEAFLMQEYYCSFEAPLAGAYYEIQMLASVTQKRITRVPWEPKLEVHTAWDLGVDDQTVIWFFQEFNQEVRVIDCYWNSGEGLPHYVKKMREKPYVYGIHYAPHDITVREFISGHSRIEAARKLGLRFKLVPRHNLADGIEAVRALLPRCWFDEENCGKGIDGLKGYRKEWNEERKTYRDTPLHDWTSNFADAFRQYAVGVRPAVKKSNLPPRAVTDYKVFS